MTYIITHYMYSLHVDITGTTLLYTYIGFKYLMRHQWNELIGANDYIMFFHTTVF